MNCTAPSADFANWYGGPVSRWKHIRILARKLRKQCLFKFDPPCDRTKVGSLCSGTTLHNTCHTLSRQVRIHTYRSLSPTAAAVSCHRRPTIGQATYVYHTGLHSLCACERDQSATPYCSWPPGFDTVRNGPQEKNICQHFKQNREQQESAVGSEDKHIVRRHVMMRRKGSSHLSLYSIQIS